jgi:nucleoside-diphosphate-sugar epimerase
MPTTLVTGANGFVAAHIIDALISSGHDIVGSVRAATKGKEILDLHPEWASKLKFVPVADYTKAGVWDEVFHEHDVDYVIHSAAPLLDDERNTDFERDFLKPGVDS